MAEASGLHLRLFGPPRADLDGAPVAFDTRKALALLALLAVTGAEHRRESLADLLWPELDPGRGRAALRRTLSVAAAVGPALEVGPSGVRLDAALVRSDVAEFRRLRASSDPDDWRRAADLADDDFLAGFGLRDSPAFDDWQLATADLLRDELSQLLARLVAHEVAAGELEAALAHARRRTRVGGVSEPAHADLIRVLAWTGDRPGALRAYRALVRLLDAELGVPPLPATSALHDDIRGDRLAPPAAAAPVAPAVDAAAPAVPAAATLVGRGPETARLDEAWARADAGAAVGLVGEPGIGKSALIRALADRVAASGAAVLAVAGHASERGLAYAIATDLVRALRAARPGAASPDLAALVDAPGERPPLRTPGDLQRLHEGFRAAVAAAAADDPLLLVVDDAHLVDGPSADLLAYLVRRLPPGLVVAAAWARGAGDAALPAAVSGAGEVVAIGPLDLAAVAGVLDDPAVDAAEVLRRTRGIPLLVREVVAGRAQSIGADAGGGVRGLVAARLSAAPALTRQLVAAAAAIGTVADPELLRIACGRDEAETVDAIEDAVGRGLLVEQRDRDGYDVPHELVRELALDDLSLARSRLVHGRVADLLARRHAVDPLTAPAGAVARHLAGAGRDADAGEWFLAAARESERLAAHAEALEHLDAALARGHAPLDAHEIRGATLVRLGRYTDALVAFDQAAALAEAEPARLAAIEHAVAGLHDRLGDWDLARAHLEAADELVTGGDPVRRARVLADLALVLHRQGEDDAAHPVAVRAADEAERVDRAALAQAMNVLGVIEQQRDPAAALARLEAAVGLAREAGDADLEIAALNNRSHAAAALGDRPGAMASAREALAGAERQGDRHRIAALHSHLADLLHAEGRESEALAELRDSAVAFAEVQGAEIRGEVWTLSSW